MPIASHIPTLESLTAPDLQELKVRWQYDVYTTEKRIAKLRQRVNRETSRFELYKAAQFALNTLRQQALEILQALVQSNVDSALREAQQAQVDKYENELKKLSAGAYLAPDAQAIHLRALRITELEHKLQRMRDAVISIDQLLGE